MHITWLVRLSENLLGIPHENLILRVCRHVITKGMHLLICRLKFFEIFKRRHYTENVKKP